MTILTCSLSRDGEKKLSANFKVHEFACKDGSDLILIDEALVALLQKIRDFFQQPITINSAYRTAAYNVKIKGAPSSQHLYGKAADIVVAGQSPLAVAQYAEKLAAPGIGYYPAGEGNFTHVDTRAGISRWQRKNGLEVTVSGFGGMVAEKQEEAPQTQKSAAQLVQEKAGLDDNTMLYLQFYRYGQELLEKLAKAML